MPVAWVGDNGRGAFSAWVDYDDPGPFSYMHGPHDVSLAEAVTWARKQAAEVILRFGDVHYSAGEEQAGGKPVWSSGAASPSAPALSGSPVVRWRADGGMGWFRSDREAVAGALAEAVERDPRAADAAVELRVPGFSVCFTLVATSALDANKVASAVLREAWAATGVEAEPGEDFDATHISVKPA